jgi:hypothetical protein
VRKVSAGFVLNVEDFSNKRAHRFGLGMDRPVSACADQRILNEQRQFLSGKLYVVLGVESS